MALKFNDRYPFSPTHMAALVTLHHLMPERFQNVIIDIRQIPEREWKHGDFRGFTDLSSNIQLKRNQWWRIPGLGLHEQVHALHYWFIANDWPRWQQAWLKAKREGGLPNSYAEKNADEGFSECTVVHLRPGLAGYRKSLPKWLDDEVAWFLLNGH